MEQIFLAGLFFDANYNHNNIMDAPAKSRESSGMGAGAKIGIALLIVGILAGMAYGIYAYVSAESETKIKAALAKQVADSQKATQEALDAAAAEQKKANDLAMEAAAKEAEAVAAANAATAAATAAEHEAAVKEAEETAAAAQKAADDALAAKKEAEQAQLELADFMNREMEAISRAKSEADRKLSLLQAAVDAEQARRLTYVFHQGKDSGSNDITQRPDLKDNIDSLQDACNNLPNCMGFNTNGWLKYAIAPESQWHTWAGATTKQGLYVRNW